MLKSICNYLMRFIVAGALVFYDDRAPQCLEFAMRFLITGVCGFVGSSLATSLREHLEEAEIVGIDNFARPGSESNRLTLRAIGVEVRHADIRCPSDIDALPRADWVIDAAANPSVLAGVDGQSSSRQLVEHNLGGTINLLEFCKRHRAGLVLLSTSRVYSVDSLNRLKVFEKEKAFHLVADQEFPVGLSLNGISEEFSTAPPVSLYGSTKLTSEHLALEYGSDFDFPVWINRCGVLAGAGQFGRADQGIFTYWINTWLRQRALQYMGFNGCGCQVRDVLHPRDLIPLIRKQINASATDERIFNAGGGVRNSISLAQLSDWCSGRFGNRSVKSAADPRPFDIPWMVLDSARARQRWGWEAETAWPTILEGIARHAEEHPTWLEISLP